jgi:hypothetical protein
VVDVSDPQQPREIGYYDTPGYNNGIALAGEYICVTEDPVGMRVFQFLGAGIEEERSTPDASRIAPGATVVRGVLMLPQATGDKRQVTSRMLDITGRKVLDLQPGPNDVSRLAPGVYFLSPGSRSRRTATRLVLTR